MACLMLCGWADSNVASLCVRDGGDLSTRRTQPTVERMTHQLIAQGLFQFAPFRNAGRERLRDLYRIIAVDDVAFHRGRLRLFFARRPFWFGHAAILLCCARSGVRVGRMPGSIRSVFPSRQQKATPPSPMVTAVCVLKS